MVEQVMRMRVAAGCFALLLLPAWPAHAQKEKPQSASVPTAGSETPDDYLIGPEDVLEISVWKEEGLQKEILVRPDGGISFPLVGDIKAAGKSAAQLQKEIAARLQKYIPDPPVSVSILKIVNNKIYVIGRVNKPGEYLTGRYIDVLQALSMAGGLTPFASENNIKVLRKEGGKEIVFPFEYGKVQAGKALEQNIRLKSGDTVVVP
jgi:polysaccharide export outer membrane protein